MWAEREHYCSAGALQVVGMIIGQMRQTPRPPRISLRSFLKHLIASSVFLMPVVPWENCLPSLVLDIIAQIAVVIVYCIPFH